MIKKQFYDIKFKVGISTEGESIITNITIPKLTLTRNMFNIEGNIIISDPGMSIISMKNVIMKMNMCLTEVTEDRHVLKRKSESVLCGAEQSSETMMSFLPEQMKW